MNEVPGVDDGAPLRYGLVWAVAAQRDANGYVILEASSPAHEGEGELEEPHRGLLRLADPVVRLVAFRMASEPCEVFPKKSHDSPPYRSILQKRVGGQKRRGAHRSGRTGAPIVRQTRVKGFRGFRVEGWAGMLVEMEASENAHETYKRPCPLQYSTSCILRYSPRYPS